MDDQREQPRADDQGEIRPAAGVSLARRLAEALEGRGANAGANVSDVCREILRAYRWAASRSDGRPQAWRSLVAAALSYLGGQGDRSRRSMRDYDADRYGPFLAISNEGASADLIRTLAARTPKGRALGPLAEPYTLGMAVDGERLGGVGEVPIGVEEFSQIWFEAVDRLLMTTNVGSRANLRFYARPPILTLPDPADDPLAKATAAIAAAQAPFRNAPGGPRPLTVYLDIGPGEPQGVDLVRSIVAAARAGGLLRPGLLELGLYRRLEGGEAGRDQALGALEIVRASGLTRLALDGVVRADADQAVSLPGLLDYLPPELLDPVLAKASELGIALQPANPADADTVARQIWSALNTARGMGFDLGKYALLPLTLEQSEAAVAQVQAWFADWSAAPVFYADQGILTAQGLLAGPRTEDGIAAWLQMVARHGVRIALVDTVDKSKGWKLVKTNDDPKGLLRLDQIGRLAALGRELGVKVMWAGGLEPADAYALGRLGVFGVYVTTAVCDAAPVTGDAYGRDPGLASLKRPDPAKALLVKTLLEAGFLLSDRVALPADLAARIAAAGQDAAALGPLLEAAWAAWWSAAPSGQPAGETAR